MTNEINPEVRQRLLTAADQLYEQGGQHLLPNVDRVRRLAKANMNDACTVMREWRSQRMHRDGPTQTTVPEEIKQANAQGLAALWNKAQEHAGEALRAAQASWDQQRRETDVLCEQMSDAFDKQGEQLAELKRLFAASQQDLAQAETRCSESHLRSKDLDLAVRTAREEAAVASARTDELARRVEDVKQLNADLRAEQASMQKKSA